MTSDARYLLAGDSSAPTSGAGRTGLPPDLLQAVPRRLRIVALFWCAFQFAVILLPTGWPWSVRGLFCAVVVVSALVAVATVVFKGAPAKLVYLGLIYEVVIVALIACAENFAPYAPTDLIEDAIRPGISNTALYIVIYPLVVPSRTLHAVVASVAAVAMLPLSLALYQHLGISDPPLGVYGWLMVQGAFVVAVAIVPHRIAMGLGRKMQQLREMGSYKLVERIGEGGMGEVWRAQHRMLARPAAIKRIRTAAAGASDEAAASQLLARFEREAQATAALRSPHTVEIYDFGVDREGAFYLVMEFLDGVDLEQLVERFGPVDHTRVVHILQQACHSLDEAHGADLIHRDIKPANVFVCHHGNDFDFVKVLDFGMVKHTGSKAEADPSLTAMGSITGTPGYMPPEIALGKDVTVQADIYSLGCLAYWLLTGRMVFEGQTAMDMVVQHINEAPTPPSELCELEIPAELERIVMKCLQKDPAERFVSVAELSQALEQAASSGSWPQERARAWWERHLPDRG